MLESSRRHRISPRPRFRRLKGRRILFCRPREAEEVQAAWSRPLFLMGYLLELPNPFFAWDESSRVSVARILPVKTGAGIVRTIGLRDAQTYRRSQSSKQFPMQVNEPLQISLAGSHAQHPLQSALQNSSCVKSAMQRHCRQSSLTCGLPAASDHAIVKTLSWRNSNFLGY